MFRFFRNLQSISPLLRFHLPALSANYDCIACPGYCCAYPVIQVNRDDVSRLAKHHKLTYNEARERFTLKESPRIRRLKMTADPVFRSDSCMFLDKKTRSCTVYEGRPEICRDHPGDHCEWYDRLRIEKAAAPRGRKVIMLKQLPWTIDSDYPLYDEDRFSTLLDAYADNGGIVEN